MPPPLNLLCVEPYFPGRLGELADWLVRRRGYRCWFLAHHMGPPASWPESTGRGLQVIQYRVGGAAIESAVHWGRHLERGLCHAYAVWETLEQARPRPVDVVLARSAGLGSSLFVPVSLPRVPIVQQFDYFLHPRRHDLADELAPTLPPDYVHWRSSANAMDLLDLENGVLPITPSAWQRDLYPPEYRADLRVLPTGVDLRPPAHPRRSPRVFAGRSIPDSTFLISFVASDLDRLCGFDRFIRLAAGLRRRGVDVVAVASGHRFVRRPYDIPNFGRDYPSDCVSLHPDLEPDRFLLFEDPTRQDIDTLLASSDLHLYPSRPYPLSRSVERAIALGSLVLAWDHPPIRDLLSHESNGLLIDPSDDEAAADLAARIAASRDEYAALRLAAAEFARQHLDRDVLMPSLEALLASSAGACPP